MKKRVLFVFEDVLSHGGIQSVMMSIVRSLHKEYIFDIMLLKSSGGIYDDEFSSYGGTIFRLPQYEGNSRFRQRADYYLRGRKIYRGILRHLKSNRYDIVHSHLTGESGLVMKAAEKAGVPVRITHSHAVHTTHNYNIIRKLIYSYQQKLIAQNASCRLVCSPAASGLFENDEFDKVVYNSYHDEIFNMALYSQNNSSNIKLVQVGRLSQDKNQEFSVNVLAELLKNQPNTTLTLVGGGDAEEKRIHSVAECLDVADRVSIIPATNKVAEILNENNVFLFPSLKEGFGIALIEAQGMGLKCFASDTVPEATNCGGVTYLPLAAGAEAWAKEIIADFEKTGGEHKKYDCSRFSEKSVMKKYRELYEGI